MMQGGTVAGPAPWDIRGLRMALPTAAYVILGHVWLGSRTGYEVKRSVEYSTRYFSTISHAQIYPLLKEMEELGLVKGESDAQGKRPRRLYEITPEGEDALRDWIRADQELTIDHRDLGLTKMFLSDLLEEDEVLELVRAIRARSERILSELRRRTEPKALALTERGVHYGLFTLGFGFTLHEAWVEYCNQIEEQILAGRASEGLPEQPGGAGARGAAAASGPGRPARRGSPRAGAGRRRK
jgi:PadR family transcriptional regulator AphA